MSILNTKRLGMSGNRDKHNEDKMIKGEQFLPISIHDIQPFERNPRQVENEKYLEIKASIAQIGLQQTLIVTKRPGDDHYVLYSGGNTRLRCLKELHEESGGERFAELTCKFVPFESDIKNLIGHVIENEERGEMLLVDKGRALYDLREYYISQLSENNTFKLKAFEAFLIENGIKSFTYSLVNIYIFAYESLYPIIPNALNSGLGKPKVIDIRKFRNALQMYFTHKDFKEFPALSVNTPDDMAVEGQFTNQQYWKQFKKNAAVELFDACLTALDSSDDPLNLVLVRDKFDLAMQRAKPDLLVSELSQEIGYILDNGVICPPTSHIVPVTPKTENAPIQDASLETDSGNVDPALPVPPAQAPAETASNTGHPDQAPDQSDEQAAKVQPPQETVSGIDSQPTKETPASLPPKESHLQQLIYHYKQLIEQYPDLTNYFDFDFEDKEQPTLLEVSKQGYEKLLSSFVTNGFSLDNYVVFSLLEIYLAEILQMNETNWDETVHPLRSVYTGKCAEYRTTMISVLTGSHSSPTRAELLAKRRSIQKINELSAEICRLTFEVWGDV